MCLCRDDSTPEEWGIFSVGPASESKVTEKSTLFCSSVQPVPPLSELIRKLNFPHHLYQYVMDGIMPSMTYCK